MCSGASIAGRQYSVCDLLVRRRQGRCSATDQSGPNIKTEKKIHQFLMALCLCHSGQVRPDSTRSGMEVPDLCFTLKVAPRERTAAGPSDLFYGCDNQSFVSEESPGESDGVPLNLDSLEYNAASPDEKAILEGCSYLGMKFAGKKAEREMRFYILYFSFSAQERRR